MHILKQDYVVFSLNSTFAVNIALLYLPWQWCYVNNLTVCIINLAQTQYRNKRIREMREGFSLSKISRQMSESNVPS